MTSERVVEISGYGLQGGNYFDHNVRCATESFLILCFASSNRHSSQRWIMTALLELGPKVGRGERGRGIEFHDMQQYCEYIVYSMLGLEDFEENDIREVAEMAICS